VFVFDYTFIDDLSIATERPPLPENLALIIEEEDGGREERDCGFADTCVSAFVGRAESAGWRALADIVVLMKVR